MLTSRVLDNRPIHQWKVTELREELKRRRLTTKGLKDDLIRRLDEALQAEADEAEAEAGNARAEDAEASEKDDAERKGADPPDAEREGAVASEKDEANGVDGDVAGVKDSQTVTVDAEAADVNEKERAQTIETSEKVTSVEVETIETENAEKIPPEVVDYDSNKNDKQDGVTIPIDINNSVSTMDQEIEYSRLPAGADSATRERMLLSILLPWRHCYSH
uniref:SAP domain-containing protein n=1 Tax=Lotus japonicus TaxID=34305 RepID=I3SEU0_LOTJA|nr:unknown [Lotus japonicus]